MSSYIIHIEHREEQDLAWVEINALSQESKSARRCRFQTIGWILSIVDTVNKKVDPRIVEDEDYAKKALVKFAKMDEAAADLLLSARDWRRRFEAVWPILDDEQREHALRYDYDDWDNYWPGFDTFNRTLYEQYYIPQPNSVEETTTPLSL